MTKRKLTILAILTLALCALLSACSSNIDGPEGLIKDGFKVVVTYDYQGGRDSQGRDFLTIHYEVNRPIINPSDADYKISKSDEKIEGWYHEVLGEGENKVYSNKVDFSTFRTSESTTLYAKWIEEYRFTLYYFADDDVNHDQPLVLENYRTTSGGIFHTNYNAKRNGYTRLGYYEDAAMTQEWRPTQNRHPGGDVIEVAVYTDWIKGSYTLVKEANDFIFGSPTANYYVMNNIDFTGKQWSVANQFSGTIVGNGCEFQNISVSHTGDQINKSVIYYGLFRELSNATISNLKFVNVTITVNLTINATYYAGLLAGTITGTTEITGCAISGSIIVLAAPTVAHLDVISPSIQTSQPDVIRAGIDTTGTSIDDRRT